MTTDTWPAPKGPDKNQAAAQRLLKALGITDQPNQRTRLLREAEGLVNGDRNRSYGEPGSDFARTASLWGTYLNGVVDNYLGHTEGPFTRDEVLDIVSHLIEPHDVAWMMVLLKISRSTASPYKRDHYADAAGYVACGWDCVNDEEEGWA